MDQDHQTEGEVAFERHKLQMKYSFFVRALIQENKYKCRKINEEKAIHNIANLTNRILALNFRW